MHYLAQAAHAFFADHFKVQRIAFNDYPKADHRIYMTGSVFCQEILAANGISNEPGNVYC